MLDVIDPSSAHPFFPPPLLSFPMPLCDCEKYCMRYRKEPKEVSSTNWKSKPYRKEYKVGSYATFRGLDECEEDLLVRS